MIGRKPLTPDGLIAELMEEIERRKGCGVVAVGLDAADSALGAAVMPADMAALDQLWLMLNMVSPRCPPERCH